MFTGGEPDLWLVVFSLLLTGIHASRWQFFKGGPFTMGVMDREARNGEYPPYTSFVKPFVIDKFPVTNKMFSDFKAKHPKFKTDAEKQKWSYVFSGYLHKSVVVHGKHPRGKMIKKEKWWLPISMASWKRPLGPGSKWEDVPEHPVVHVSKRDAAAFCSAIGMRLPTEFEWEYAARGKNDTREYPWGPSYERGRVNLYQGDFPRKDAARDGWAGTNPVTFFPPQNNERMYDMVGNVWEWTKTTWHRRHQQHTIALHHFVLRGGSHMDSRKGRVGAVARIATRMKQPHYFSAGNIGFRCARSVKVDEYGNFEDEYAMNKIRQALKPPVFHTEL